MFNRDIQNSNISFPNYRIIKKKKNLQIYGIIQNYSPMNSPSNPIES